MTTTRIWHDGFAIITARVSVQSLVAFRLFLGYLEDKLYLEQLKGPGMTRTRAMFIFFILHNI